MPRTATRRRIDEVIVHCTATRPDWHKGATVAKKTAKVRHWHVKERGWSDIGYHFLIDRDGAVAEGRPLERPGAHAKGHNAHSIGVALFGGHGGGRADRFEDHYTPAQENALRELIVRLRAEHGPLKVTGHNRYSARACPCFDVARWLKGQGPRRSAAQSTTVQASTAQIAAASCACVSAVAGLDGSAQIVAIGLAGMVILSALWILRERLAKWGAGDR